MRLFGAKVVEGEEIASAKALRQHRVQPFQGTARRLLCLSDVSNGRAMGSEARQARGSSWALLSLPGLSSVLGSVARLPLDLPRMETGQNTIGEVLFWGLCLGIRGASALSAFFPCPKNQRLFSCVILICTLQCLTTERLVTSIFLFSSECPTVPVWLQVFNPGAAGQFHLKDVTPQCTTWQASWDLQPSDPLTSLKTCFPPHPLCPAPQGTWQWSPLSWCVFHQCLRSILRICPLL